MEIYQGDIKQLMQKNQFSKFEIRFIHFEGIFNSIKYFPFIIKSLELCTKKIMCVTRYERCLYNLYLCTYDKQRHLVSFSTPKESGHIILNRR